MKKIEFPLSFEFKINTIANDFIIKDANGRVVSYVRQKLLKLKEDILCYEDQTKSNGIYRIKANQWIDFSATYTFWDNQNKELGKVARKGLSSIWRARYEVYDIESRKEFLIKEENPWVRIMDSLLNNVPFLGIFSGYFFNPSYLVLDSFNIPMFRLSKQSSFFGRRFRVDKLGEVSEEQQERVMLSLMMMILLERRRG